MASKHGSGAADAEIDASKMPKMPSKTAKKSSDTPKRPHDDFKRP